MLPGCAVHVFEPVFAIWQFVLIDLGNGDRDNLNLSFLVKVNKQIWVNIQNL